MQYDLGQQSRIKTKIIAKVTHEFEMALKNNNVEEFLEKYGIVFDEECVPVDTKRMKIIVFGDIAGSVYHFQAAARDIGICPDNIVFENDYDKLTNYDTERLRNSYEFSDIIMACVPHMMKNLNGYNSFTSKIKAEQNQYPRLTESPDPHSQKLTVSGFKECLKKTRFFEKLE